MVILRFLCFFTSKEQKRKVEKEKTFLSYMLLPFFQLFIFGFNLLLNEEALIFNPPGPFFSFL